jgi:DNA-binding CsgD family transcriptional regulator/tetratricopeptide (TPR) repeat protein
MKLLEREKYLDQLENIYQEVKSNYGHTVFIYGEAGIGKTSLVNYFLQSQPKTSYVFSGACDSLYTPRPLGPLYDISGKIGNSFSSLLQEETNRPRIFTALLEEFQSRSLPVILIFEDIHWADEATADLIKFLCRRIQQTKCMFILTFRDNESTGTRRIIADIPPGSFTRIEIAPLSKKAVDQWAEQLNYSGEDIYRLTNGNPFYISEILASYSDGIPENIKDSILNVFYRQHEEVREFWEKISIHPGRIEAALLEKIDPDYLEKLEACLRSSVLQTDGKYVYFKHDLYRRAIEETINPIQTRLFHKEILDLVLMDQVPAVDNVRIVHYAKMAEDSEKIVEYAPKAAADASKLGAHEEAATFYKMALASSIHPEEHIINLSEKYAYECYLTNQIREAITTSENTLAYFQKNKNLIKEGDTLRFLSRLWWLEGQREKAEIYALKAIEVLENGNPTRERALSYSNFAQLKMLAYQADEAVIWAKKAIQLAGKLNDIEIICHALNNMGTAQLHQPERFREGQANLLKSLKIGLENGFHEHVARAYTNLSSAQIFINNYEDGYKYLMDGIDYCEERDLDSWTYYMLSWKAQAELDRGNWKEAEKICDRLLESKIQSIVKIGTLVVKFTLNIRRGNRVYVAMLHEAGEMALRSGELQRIIPVLSAYLEYYWLYRGEIPQLIIDKAIDLLIKSGDPWSWGKLIFWAKKCRINIDLNKVPSLPALYELINNDNWEEAGREWEKRGCPYYHAICLMECGIEEKKKALMILKSLETVATEDKLKRELRELGFKTIPRGPRKSTRMNLAQLTNRQVEVLSLLKEGYSNHEIAEQLFVSRKTIDHHVSAILSKLEVKSRNKAVQEAINLGILK